MYRPSCGHGGPWTTALIIAVKSLPVQKTLAKDGPSFRVILEDEAKNFRNRMEGSHAIDSLVGGEKSSAISTICEVKAG